MELSRESSMAFGDALLPFIENMINSDFKLPFEQCDLALEMKSSCLTHQGQLTPEYQYIREISILDSLSN